MNDFHYYRQLSFEELISDPEFRRWVFSPSEESNKYWQELLDKYPKTSETVLEARSFLLATKLQFEVKNYPAKQLEENLKEVLTRRDFVQGKRIRILHRKLTVWPATAWWLVAAIGLLALTVAIWSIVSETSDDRTYKTSYGQWEELYLPDGSSVHLNANSKLTLGKDWSDGSIQKVWLEGEAFFDVEKKSSAKSKFQVIAGELVIEVLGTQFNVQKRGKETEVFLKEGKIKLDMAGQIEYMTAGQFVAYSEEKKAIISTHTVPQESYTSWKEGTLLMNTTVGEFLEEIKQIYGVEIDVIDSNVLLETRKFAVPMEQLEMVIPILETSLGKQITKDGNKLVIR